jgi:hypothetical protein
MNQKSPLKSLTIWSGVTSSVSGLALIITLLLQQFQIETESSEVEIILLGLINVISGCTTVYGRYRAKTQIAFKGNAL